MFSHTRRFLLPSSLLLSVLFIAFSGATEPKPAPKQIAHWVAQLGDNDFKVRENASKKLWEAGASAEPALEKALQTDDPEVVRRARELLDKFRWGIYPDTPADIVALIRAYQSSKDNTRLELLQKLFEGGEPGLRAALKIVAAEKDADRRKALGDLIAAKLTTTFVRTVTEGKHEHFERLLELGREGKFTGANQYAAYWLLRGKLAERIAHFRARLSEHPEDKWTAQTLAYLYRANGDLAQARKAAEKSGRTDLVEGILFEMADWKALPAREDSTAEGKRDEDGPYHVASPENPAEKWGYRAAYARLAGKQKEFDKAVRELQQFAESKEKNDSQALAAAKGLLLNNRPTEGLELLRTLPEHRLLLFDVLCARLDFAAALDLAAKEVPNDKEVPSLGLARARLLCLLGDKEGEALFDRFGERIKKDVIYLGWVESLLMEEMRAGLKEKAFTHAAEAMGGTPPGDGRGLDHDPIKRLCLTQLFPQQTNTAFVWWMVLHWQFPDESPIVLLKRLNDLLEGKVEAEKVKTWIARTNWMEKPKPNRPPIGSEARLAAERKALAEVAAKAGLDDLASSLLEKADSSAALLRLGDLLAAKKQWQKAAERYRQAWMKDLLQVDERLHEKLHDPLPLYLAGDALVRAGQEKEGKKLTEQSHWMPFADATTRYSFLRSLTERGHKEAARREAELLLRMSEPFSFYSAEALRYRAIAALASKDYLKAADGFEQSMLQCIHPSTSFTDKANFANAPAKIHQLRAMELLAAGKLDEALKQVELAWTDSPGYVNLPIALVPELERRGHKKESADIFNRYYRLYEKVCRDYPRCAWAHNEAAWLAVCCHRNLDQALGHGSKAVELAPSHAGYHDTLAEVHFQRGDKDKAVALQKRVIELNPKKAYYRKQLKRLEAGDPSAERPVENGD